MHVTSRATYAIFLEGHNHVILQQSCQLLLKFGLRYCAQRRLCGAARDTHTHTHSYDIVDATSCRFYLCTHLLAPHRKTGVCSAKATPMTHNAISDFHNIFCCLYRFVNVLRCSKKKQNETEAKSINKHNQTQKFWVTNQKLTKTINEKCEKVFALHGPMSIYAVRVKNFSYDGSCDGQPADRYRVRLVDITSSIGGGSHSEAFIKCMVTLLRFNAAHYFSIAV